MKTNKKLLILLQVIILLLVSIQVKDSSAYYQSRSEKTQYFKIAEKREGWFERDNSYSAWQNINTEKTIQPYENKWALEVPMYKYEFYSDFMNDSSNISSEDISVKISIASQCETCHTTLNNIMWKYDSDSDPEPVEMNDYCLEVNMMTLSKNSILVLVPEHKNDEDIRCAYPCCNVTVSFYNNDGTIKEINVKYEREVIAA